jgi:hypothetical protein
MIFTDDFLAVDSALIAKEIKSSGFFAFERALTPAFLDQIAQDVERSRFGLNANMVTGVYVNQQYFLTHMLAVSKAFFDYCTHAKVFDISQELLARPFRLKALRYYETFGGYHMQWHTDNKTDRGVAPIPGIIFIAYVSDVRDGEFQYVKGSQQWSGVIAYNDYADAYIDEKYAKDVVSFKLPRGSIVIYDTYGIHRARPVDDAQFSRQSLFFQIDAELNNAEPILVNTEFLDRAESRIATYLGFGLPGHYPVFPQSNLTTLPMSHATCAPLLRWMAHGVALKAWQAVPSPLRVLVKGALGRKKPA